MSCKAIIDILCPGHGSARLHQCYDGHLAGCGRDLWTLLMQFGISWTTPAGVADALHRASQDDTHPWKANCVLVDVGLPLAHFTYDYHYQVRLHPEARTTLAYRHRRGASWETLTVEAINLDIMRTNRVLRGSMAFLNLPDIPLILGDDA